MPNNALQNILYIEDDEALARLLQKRMERLRFTVDIVSSAEEGLVRLQQKNYDLVLIDYNLPGMNGIEMLDSMMLMQSTPPSIILTTSGDERIALKALEKGATDYAVKDTGQTYLDLLPAVMQASFTRERLQRENEQQKRDLELAVKKAEDANEAKTNFLATMSHEIRTPLNVVTGLADILTKTSLDEKQKKIVHTLQNNADLLLKIINDLLDISRIESGEVNLEYTHFTITSILEDIQTMFSSQIAQKNLELVIDDNTSAHTFKGDRTRIQQIIMNLVSNAIKFTEKGRIDIIVTVAANDIPANPLHTVTIAVYDTGIGMGQKELSTIFEKFTQADPTITRRFGGSGLGLSIARSLARLMQGDITVTTEPGKGSKFTITLSLEETSQKTALPQETPRDNLLNTEKKSTILLVEDYAPNIMVATFMLEDLGFEVISAESGEAALEIVSRATTPFFAILMDVQMQAMDGLKTTRLIRTLETKIGFRNTIIGITAHALAGDRERCISAGMDDYMSKPIHPDILTSKLMQLVTAPKQATSA